MRRGLRSIVLFAVGSACAAACGSSAGDPASTPRPADTIDASAPHDASSPFAPDASASGDDDASTPGDDASSAGDVATMPFGCAGKTGAKGDMTLAITSGGLPRTSLFHVPTSYDPSVGAALVLNFHGFSSDATQQTLLTGMSAVADTRGFLVAYPQGIGNGWNAGDCCTQTQPANIDDVGFVRDLIASISHDYCVDPKRIFATGMSNGGFLSHRLACDMADVIAAVAPVAGVLGIAPTTCTPPRSVPILDFHGTADPVVPYDGGMTNPDPLTQGFTSVQATINFWRERDACLSAPVTTYAKGDATCVRYDGCANGASVTLCTIDGGGHTWPGGLPVPPLGKTSTDIDATGTMIDFFFAHPLP